MAAGACNDCGCDYGEYGCREGICRFEEDATEEDADKGDREEEGPLQSPLLMVLLTAANLDYYYYRNMEACAPPSE